MLFKVSPNVDAEFFVTTIIDIKGCLFIDIPFIKLFDALF